jgi:hypothetical protein
MVTTIRSKRGTRGWIELDVEQDIAATAPRR